MENRTWKVGELSKLTGLTIRTLHHYDETGLLCPASHTDAGHHRLYTESDIIKLQQIMYFRDLGFCLAEIKEMLEDHEYDPKEVLDMQIERLSEEIRLKTELQEQLRELKRVFSSWERPTPGQFIKAIELIRNQNRYFTQEQRIKLKKQYEKLNADEAGNLEKDWSKLISMLQGEMEKGTPYHDAKVTELAKRWQEGMDFFTGGDISIIQSAERFYIDNPQAAKGSGMTGELYAYIKNALTMLE